MQINLLDNCLRHQHNNQIETFDYMKIIPMFVEAVDLQTSRISFVCKANDLMSFLLIDVKLVDVLFVDVLLVDALLNDVQLKHVQLKHVLLNEELLNGVLLIHVLWN